VKIGIINAHNIAVYQSGKPNQTDPVAKNTNPGLSKKGEVNPNSATASATNDSEKSSDKTRGVIRLLQEGHFKGVADVRLRINFHEELTGRENAQLKAVADARIEDVNAALETAIDSLVENETLTSEQIEAPMEEFSQSVVQAKEEFTASDSPSKEDLASALHSAFETLTASIHEILYPTNEDIPTLSDETNAPQTSPESIIPDELPEEPTTQDPSNTATDWLENLTAAFTSALDKLMSSFAEIQVLPDVSEPTGNGVAYQKFLAIYNELRGVETPQPDSQENEPLDVIG
jgi:hypothetical protein